MLAQNVTVSGKVINDSGEELKDATVRVSGIDQTYYTSSRGEFSIELEAFSSYTLRIKYSNHSTAKIEVVTEDKDIQLAPISLIEKSFDEVIIRYQVRKNIDPLPPVDPSRIPTVSGNFEDFIKVAGLGVNSNNELTANYNVRGGNYDENLIYVNGIQIYRPFLARSGQQEGLSFINSSFVEKIYFSAGGFDSYYGDKLSSVLDVTYREPTKWGASLQGSLMGGQVHVEGIYGKKRGNFITGARYRANSYILNSLPTQGDYNPTFFDYQLLTNYYLDYGSPNDYKKLYFLGHYSSNNYRFVPSTRNTSWGTINEAYELRVFFDGQEETKFNTLTGALGLEWRKSSRLKMNFTTSAFRSVESEHFDILGQYWINQLETDPSKEEFGDSTSNVGVGGFLDHARNDLNVLIGNVYYTAVYNTKRIDKEEKNRSRFGEIYWGAKGQYELFEDKLSEWHTIDSAGYLIPGGDPDVIELRDVVKQNNIVENYRGTAHLQFTQNFIKKKDKIVSLKRKIKTDSAKYIITTTDTIRNSPGIFSFTLGTRGGYRSYNDEYWITPRMNMTFRPRSYLLQEDSTVARRNLKFRFSSGLYYQPPFYRTMRGINGTINPDVVSQKSWHNVVGADIYFKMWGREFKFITEAYYKHMWDVVPYEIDNVRIRYYAENSAVAYAYGVDAKINGEFVKGVESFFRVGFLKTMEDIANDDYYIYLNSDGDTIVPGFTFNDTKADSILQQPGWIPRPTDQTLTFSVFFQDRMPRFENFKVSTSILFGTPLPYGPPTYERYKDVLRTKAYMRVDLGFMYDIINQDSKEKYKDKKFLKHFEQMTISLDAFNLLGINNIISYQWLQDVGGRYYAIPNHLTGRRINLRFIVKI